ncbi:MAG: 2-oxoglutarate dehydrogenase complex dihydrolipoyllysine-residue succinyltransferase [Chlorobi bacterium]|nr:2-oxoglutarate dehydrogenase complex dihydrolipoyllysine-residue succinyltransferase [Chlorobiota bacterium]
MKLEIKIPSPGESITEVEVAAWLVEDGDYVEKNQEIAEVESEKATLPVIAEESGKVKFLIESGTQAKVGDIICTIDTDAAVPVSSQGEEKPGESATSTPAEKASTLPEKETAPQPEPVEKNTGEEHVRISPLAREKMKEHGLSLEDILDGIRRITAEDVEKVAGMKTVESSFTVSEKAGNREKTTTKMSPLRRKLGERLVSVKNETAMLTTFNEADMSAVIALRKKYQTVFTEKHGIKLGFMSFFAKAAAIALEKYPAVNSVINGEEIVSFHYADIGIAVQTDKGLMVPVIRNAESMSLAGIEKALKNLAGKARKNRISMDDMAGGTFTITNGGVFGSMLSTPILNPPQAGILGMHNIVERPVAINGKVEVRPVMYIALSYDHRLVDGRDSVGFLKTVKELIENPALMITGGEDPYQILLNL